MAPHGVTNPGSIPAPTSLLFEVPGLETLLLPGALLDPEVVKFVIL